MNLCELRLLFPMHLREELQGKDWEKGLEEIRVRIGQPIEFTYGDCSKYFMDGTYCVTNNDILEMFNYISSYSLYAYQEELKQGFITIEGGHRIGIAGQATVVDGKIEGIFPVGFLNLRIAHEKKGVAKQILPLLWEENEIKNTLVMSASGAGKTTFLRDCIRTLSSGDEKHPGMKVAVVDERSEIAACYHGEPQNDLGPRTDVLDGCSKAEGILMLIRSMSPQIIAVDELGLEQDFFAVEQAANCGSRVIGTIHAGSVDELVKKPFLEKWLEHKLFQRFVQIEKQSDGTRRITLFDENLECIC